MKDKAKITSIVKRPDGSVYVKFVTGLGLDNAWHYSKDDAEAVLKWKEGDVVACPGG